MATKTRNPTGDLSFTGTWTGTAGSRWQNVDDFPDSGNPIADGLTHGTTAGVGLFTFAAFDVPVGATIVSLAIQYFDFKTASQSCNIGANIRCNDTTDRAAATHNPGNGNANIAQRTDTYSTNPKTGVAWTVDDINGVGTNGLTAFGWKSSDASPSITLSSIQALVTYTITSILTADSGAFSETGTAALFNRIYSAIAASGSFAESGTSAAFRVALSLQAASALFAESGITAALGKNFAFPVAGDIFALSGTDAALSFNQGTQNLTLAADAGSFAESGTAVALPLGRRIASSPGAYSESGLNASFPLAWRIPVSAGAISESGIAAGTLFQAKPVLAPGSFIESGIAAALLRSLTIVSDTAAFAWTGSNAALSGAGQKTIAADSGALNLTGRAASLLRSLQMASNAGTWSWTGAAFQGKINHRAVENSGDFAWQGFDAGLDWQGNKIIVADSAAFLLSGIDAGLINASDHVSVSSLYSRSLPSLTVAAPNFDAAFSVRNPRVSH